MVASSATLMAQNWPVGWLPRFRQNFVRILSGLVMCDPRHRAFSGATSCCNNTAELTFLQQKQLEQEKQPAQL